MKHYIIGLTISLHFINPLSAMEIKLYQLPSASTLKERFSATGFQHFIDKTNLDTTLGDTKKDTFQLILEVNHALYQYKEYTKNPTLNSLMQQNKPIITTLILLDHPEALKELQEGYWNRNSRIQ